MTTLDVVAKRAPCPVLIVQQRLSQPEATFQAILLPVFGVGVLRAAEWSLTLAESDAQLTLLNVVDRASLETSKEVVQYLVYDKVSDSSVARVLGKEIQLLTARLDAELDARDAR